jgi:RNA polymerase sigma-70 factor (ECF subfamily)
VNHHALLMTEPLAKTYEPENDGKKGRDGELSHGGSTSALDTRRGRAKLRPGDLSATFEALRQYKSCVDEDAAPDAEVLRLLQGGQRARAFELLLSRLQGKVFRLAMSYVRSRADAEDLAQEAFVRIWRALLFYDGRASFSTWSYAITRNTCLSELRRRRSRPTSPLDEAAELRPADRPSPTATSDLRFDCAALLMALPETQRQVVSLFYLEERSYQEVAALVGMPLNTVRSHLHRARRRLALLLGARR